MSKLRPQIHQKLVITGRYWRSSLYLFLLGSTLLVLIPWSMFLSPFTGLLIGFVLLAGIVIWMQLRLQYLQSRTRRLEHQLHRLVHQGSASRINKQAVSHLEAERYFSRDQTRH